MSMPIGIRKFRKPTNKALSRRPMLICSAVDKYSTCRLLGGGQAPVLFCAVMMTYEFLLCGANNTKLTHLADPNALIALRLSGMLIINTS